MLRNLDCQVLLGISDASAKMQLAKGIQGLTQTAQLPIIDHNCTISRFSINASIVTGHPATKLSTTTMH